MRFKSVAQLFVGASMLAVASTAHAQVAPSADAAATGTSGADIVVTAQRRAEKVTQVPISITVANQAQLERQQIDTVNDLNRIAPSLEIQSAPGQNTGGGGSIRGIGTQTFSAGAVASVGVVVDQVSQGNANISDLFDVARIEVLKGPQGTLFGLTTSAGVINITTNKPEFDTFSARLRTELSHAGTAGSRYGDQIVQGVVNLPLAHDAALRIAGFGNMRQGPDYDLTSARYDKNDSWGLRGRLLWEPTSQLTINLIGDYGKTRTTEGGDFFTLVKSSGAGLLPLPTPFPIPDNVTANLASCGVTAGVGNRNFCTGQYFLEHSYSGGASLEIDYQAAPFTITSVTAYRKSLESGDGAATNVFRGDPLELQVTNGPVHRPIDLFTQELRVSSPANQMVEYTGGLFFSSQIQHRDDETLAVEIQPVPGFYIPVENSGTSAFHVSDVSMAIFGQATVHAADKLRLIVGGRYTDDLLKLDTVADSIPGSINSHTSLDSRKFSWKLGAQYDVTRKTMVYATVTRGFKGGQIATPANAASYAVLPEIPTSYEAGLKSTLLAGWVLDANLFYQNVKDFQSQNCVTTDVGAISCTVSNIDGVKSRGAEIDLFGRVTKDLSITTGFLYAKATYPKAFLGTDGTDIGDTQLAYAPRYKFTFSGQYDQPITDRFKGFVAADAVWKSRIRYEANSISESTFGPHWTAGGRVGVETDDGRYQAAIFVRNLFNVHEPELVQSSFPYSGGANVGAIYGPGSFRQVGISLDGKF